MLQLVKQRMKIWTTMKTTPDWQFATAEDKPVIETRLLVRIGIVLAIINMLIVIAAPLARLYLQVPEMTAFRIFSYALQAGVVLGVLGLLLMIITSLTNNRFATRGGLMMLVPGLLIAAAFIAMIGPANLTRPVIHDISTDTENPPQFVEVKKLRSADQNPVDYAGAEIAARQQSAYPDLQPIRSSMNTDDALTEAIQVVKDLGWEFINIDYDKGIVEAYDTTSYGTPFYDTTKIFGLADDIIIRVQREGTGSRIDVRSVSRFGKADFGKNADRIRQFISTFRS